MNQAGPATGRYRAFGLDIDSEIELPELAAGAGVGEVRIRIGEVSGSAQPREADESWFDAEPGRLLLSIVGVGRYLVRGGEEIVVAPEPGADPLSLRIFLLGSAFAALLHQRGLLTLHGSAVAVGGAALLFLGESGAGKSTLAATCRERGHAVIADDVCCLELDDEGRPRLHPGYPQLKLWSDAVARLEADTASLRLVSPDEDKFGLPVRERFVDTALAPARVYLLEAGERPALHPLSTRELFTALIGQTFRSVFLQGLGLREKHFGQCLAVAGAVTGRRLVRGSTREQLDALIDLLERDVAEGEDS